MSTAPRYANAVCKARDLITDLRIQAPDEIVIEKIAAFMKAPVRYAPLSGCDGRMVRAADLSLITVNESISRWAQKRIIIAHELGHVLLHPEIRQIDEVDIKQTRNFNHFQAPEELEANYFAAEILMPKVFFQQEVQRTNPDWDSIRALAERYQTTLSATAIQYVHFAKEAVMLVASEGGEKKWFVIGDYAQDFFLNDFQRVHRYTCAQELLAENKTRSRAKNVPAGAWFNRFDPNGKECITEDSMRARGSNFILSLLWIHDDI